MRFSAGDNKAEQYGTCSDILADTLGYLGQHVPDAVRGRWGSILAGIALADDVAEETPEVFASEAGVHTYLAETMRLSVNEKTLRAAMNMIRASSCSLQSDDIEDYLDSRRNEAIFSTDLLHAQTPELPDERLWHLIGNMTIAGIYLDSFYDAKEDARDMPQFTARELAWNSGKRLYAEVQHLGVEVVTALSRASIKNGLAGHLILKLPQKLS